MPTPKMTRRVKKETVIREGHGKKGGRKHYNSVRLGGKRPPPPGGEVARRKKRSRIPSQRHAVREELKTAAAAALANQGLNSKKGNANRGKIAGQNKKKKRRTQSSASCARRKIRIIRDRNLTGEVLKRRVNIQALPQSNLPQK